MRVALGARPVQLLEMILRQGGFMALSGIVLGMSASLVATRWIRGLLFGVEPFDPATLGIVTVLFGAVAFAACVVPATRAARVDPMTALRSD